MLTAPRFQYVAGSFVGFCSLVALFTFWAFVVFTYWLVRS